VLKGTLFAVTIIGAVALTSGSATASHAFTKCLPPVGPGDVSHHSDDLRVAYVTCSTGRRVALRCRQFSYGHAGTCPAGLVRWDCTSTNSAGLRSTEKCVAGRRFVRITWTD